MLSQLMKKEEKRKMHYGPIRATAIALSTMIQALLLASSLASIPMVHGQISATVSPKDYPIYCDSTGNLVFTFDTGGQTWYGVAIELPKDFLGLVDGNASKVSAPDITYDPRFISVYDETLHYPYNRSYYWVEIGATPRYAFPTWPGITGSQKVILEDITAPGVAGDYTVNLYYTNDYFPCTYLYTALNDFSDGNRGTALPSVTIRVHMREEASVISGTVSDTTFSPSKPLNDGFVTATAADWPLRGKVVAKTRIGSDGTYALTGLYNGTFKLTAWGKWTAVDTVAAYTPTELTVVVGRKATSTVNIAVNRGEEISGSIKLYDGTTPVTPAAVFAGSFSLPRTGPGGTPVLPVRLELIDSAGTVVQDITVNVPEASTSVNYSIKELYGYKGISAGTYTLKAYALGFIQTTAVSVPVSAPGGVSIDVPLVKGGGISGTLYYITAQGTTYTLTADTTVLVEAYDLAGAMRGVWIGTALRGQAQTRFLIRGTGESIKPAEGSGFTTVALKTYSGRGMKDSGLTDGAYNIKVYVTGFVQPTPYATTVISYAATGTVSIYLKRGGTISGSIYAKDPTGVYAENWQRAPVVTYAPWEYNPATYPNTRIQAYIYDAAGLEVGYSIVYQNPAAQTATFSFSGMSRTTDYLQAGYEQTALPDGTYIVKVFTLGYWQAMPYPAATIYSGGTQTVQCPVRRGGVVTGTITFKEAGAMIPLGITGLLKVEAVDVAGVTQGVSFYGITAAQQQTYYVYGRYKCRRTFPGEDLDGGLADGTYTVKLTLSAFTHPRQTVTVAGGSSASLVFDAYRMGMVTGTVRGAVTHQATPVPLSWVKITLASSTAAYTTYSVEGSYSIRVPDGTYMMTFSLFGYKPHAVTVAVASGTTQPISADLAESFEPIPEFPLGAIFPLAASLGLAFYLLRWIRKPIVTRAR
jgi:hypothetical protein